MRVATSGSRKDLTDAQKQLIRHKIMSLPAGTTVITGGCVGVDAFIAEVAYHSGHLRVHTVMPADRGHVDPKWLEHCHTYDEMPDGTTFRQRDERVVFLGHNLLAFPQYGEWHHETRTGDTRSIRSGTWMTVRIARKTCRPVEVFTLEDV